MPELLSSIPFIRADVRNEVSVLQNMVYEINDLQKAGNITNWKSWGDKRVRLDEMISKFNRKQILQIKHNSSIDDSHQLLPLYLENQTYIQATQKVSQGYSAYNVFITYQSKMLGFSDFFRSQYRLTNKYHQMWCCFSAMAYHIFEYTKEQNYGKYLFNLGGANPYSDERFCSLIGYKITESHINTIGGIKKCLTDVFHAICGDDIAPITGKIARCFILGICTKQTIEELIDVVFLTYVYIKKKITFDENKIDLSYGISRHVAWCCFRGKNKECVLLGQPCHASVDCTFYREDSAKKARLK